MNPPSVLLDESFLLAVVDADDANHDEAVAIYSTLIDDFVNQRCLLVARADHLKAADRHDLFSAIDKLHVARQHRRTAASVVERTGVGADEAITLVLIQRYRIRKVATFHVQMTAYDFDIIDSAPTASNFAGTETVSASTTLEPQAD